MNLELESPVLLRREIAVTHAFLALTAVASALLAWELIVVLQDRLHAGAPWLVAEQLAFMGIAVALLYGCFVYQVTRLGFLNRRRSFTSADPDDLDRVFDEATPPSVAVLVPAYREEPAVVRKTLLSAAFQDYPRRRVVLLIDDPPQSGNADAENGLVEARLVPKAVAEELMKPATHFRGALDAFLARLDAGRLEGSEETALLARFHREAAAWFEAQASNESMVDHMDRFFVDLVLRGRAREYSARAERIEAAGEQECPLDERALLRGYRRLAAQFEVEISSFERKRYQNLSHEPNKAMNLNSYLGLLGRRMRGVPRNDGLYLEDAGEGEAGLLVEDAEYVVTLDADSVLAPDYVLRLLQWLRKPGRERVAVVQTPYRAFPSAPGLLERVAGATTDIQFMIHQGFTRHDATYWVGANALLRTEALRDIRSVRRERGHPVPVFIQDRTVIEDTESSIDLIAQGWSLHNYPDRLSWSATPPDFGSLVVQRDRWANGGLLVLPKLLRHLWSAPLSSAKLFEGWLRCHYLVSIAAVNVSLLALLLWPFENALSSIWFPVAALPYFALYTRDLVRLGYPARDMLHAYALNLLLLPVHLGAVWKSLRQALTGRRTPFGRTPKVPGETPAPTVYHVAEYALVAAIGLALMADVFAERWFHATFLMANGSALLFALNRFVGWRQTCRAFRIPVDDVSEAVPVCLAEQVADR